MRKIFVLTMLVLLSLTQAAAQEFEYVPFVREGVKWVCMHMPTLDFTYCFTLELKGDTVINGKTYKAMHKYTGEEINWDDDTVLVYLREQDKVVYGIVPDGKTYTECPIGLESYPGYLAETLDNPYPNVLEDQITSGQEFVLYDFSDMGGFIDGFIPFPYPVWKYIADGVLVGSHRAHRYIFDYLVNCHNCCLIEGIGYDGNCCYPLAVMSGIDGLCLSHVVEDGEIIYMSENYKLFESNENYDKLQGLVREGVQWVNERVVIDHGDTTTYEYTYEFRGERNGRFPICYSYTGEELDTDQAEIVAISSIDYEASKHCAEVQLTLNSPFSRVVEEGRDQIVYVPQQNRLYKFSTNSSDICCYNPVNFFIYNQKEEFLNRYNFYEVDPLFIDGIECKRYCYVDEEGNPQAYITEGIGFDSYDMGDLLTPFTKRPDPNADHQEYWGLSHVVKDGKIIYKGLRYHGGIIGDGDVNGDGVVNIADVTAMITLLMHGNGRYNKSGDMDGSGANNIADLTMLISGLLTGSDTAK